MGIENLLAQGYRSNIEPYGNALMRAQEYKTAQQRNALLQMQGEDLHAQRQLALEQARATRDSALLQKQWRDQLPLPQGQQVPGQPAMNAAQAESAVGSAGYGGASSRPSFTPPDPRMLALTQLAKTGGITPADFMKEAYPAPEKPTMHVVNGALVRSGPAGVQELYKGAEKQPGLPSGMRMGANGPEWIPAYLDGRKQIAAQGAARVSVNTDSLGLKPKDRFEMEGKLADDYKGVTKLDNLVLSATSKIKTALSQKGALKDQAAIYSFAKMLDPEGAVREADYAAIANTTGLVDRVRGYLNRLATGEQLNDTQRAEMVTLMEAFEGVANQRVAKAQSGFADQAQRYNLRPEAVYGGAATSQAPKKPGVVNFGDLK